MGIRVRGRPEDSVLLALNTEEGDTNQRMQVTYGNWKRQGMASSPRPPEGTTPADTLILPQ